MNSPMTNEANGIHLLFPQHKRNLVRCHPSSGIRWISTHSHIFRQLVRNRGRRSMTELVSWRVESTEHCQRATWTWLTHFPFRNAVDYLEGTQFGSNIHKKCHATCLLLLSTNTNYKRLEVFFSLALSLTLCVCSAHTLHLACEFAATCTSNKDRICLQNASPIHTAMQSIPGDFSCFPLHCVADAHHRLCGPCTTEKKCASIARTVWSGHVCARHVCHDIIKWIHINSRILSYIYSTDKVDTCTTCTRRW